MEVPENFLVRCHITAAGQEESLNEILGELAALLCPAPCWNGAAGQPPKPYQEV